LCVVALLILFPPKTKKKYNSMPARLLVEAITAGLALQDFAEAYHEEAKRVPEDQSHPVSASAPLHQQCLDYEPEANREYYDAEYQPYQASWRASARCSSAHYLHFCHNHITSLKKSIVGYINFVAFRLCRTLRNMHCCGTA
jgi:hypothetical protein